MTRTEVLAKVKELGIKTERPAHQMKTEVLISLIHKYIVIEDHKTRGRKINPTSTRQQKLTLRTSLIENGQLKRGRPINSESNRQQRLILWEAKKLKGEVIKRGRPKMAF
jgi:hypothetical protein